MAKRKAGKRKKATVAASKGRKRTASRPAKKATRAAKKRPAAKRRPAAKASSKAAARKRPPVAARKKSAAGPRKAVRRTAPPKATRLDRARRTLEDTVQTPPSSLDMVRRGTAARTGRAEMAESELNHRGMDRSITGGDVDVDVEDAYFTGEEAPGGDNPTPDQDVVDDIGKALGVEYEDNEELKAADKVIERDRKRWELDPASSEDYRERK